jgi:hypothetical protein
MPDDVHEGIDLKMEGKSVWSKETLESIGFDGKHYVPWQAVHERFHELAQEEENGSAVPGSGQGAEGGSESSGGFSAPPGGGFCGGFEGGIPSKDWARSAAIGSIMAGRIIGNPEIRKLYGGGIGAESGNIRLQPAPLPTPPWVSAVQEFARAIVRTVLADRASHTRPQQALRAMGYHAPSMKPRWADFPDTVCLLVDTSGSMMGILGQVLPAVEYLRQHNITTRLIAGDTVVTVDEEIGIGGQLPALVGGGGTDIIPLFRRAEDYTPRAIVCFSDGYVNSWPGAPYDEIDTLWICDLESVPYGKQIRTG